MHIYIYMIIAATVWARSFLVWVLGPYEGAQGSQAVRTLALVGGMP